MQKRLRERNNEAIALSTYVKLMRAAESLTARVHKHLASVGLTISQFGVLEALYHVGPLSQRDLGRKILRSSGNITLVIDNLEKRSLVKRKRNRADRRFFIVHLTDEVPERQCPTMNMGFCGHGVLAISLAYNSFSTSLSSEVPSEYSRSRKKRPI